MAKLRLDKSVVQWSLKHILLHGDTDVFPHPIEFNFFRDCLDEIAEALSSINLHEYRPRGLIESLTPKDRFGFRITHQLHPVDAVIFTAAVVSVGEDIERVRVPVREHAAFSFRFDPTDEGDMFSARHRYKDWLQRQMVLASFDNDFTHIVQADIADFYQRIYHHRLRNCLDYATNGSPYANFIFKMVRDFRIRQSFGLPVGGNAARLLAELVLSDTDKALHDEGYDFTRYVDDFVIFTCADQDPYGALAFLAEHLATNEGLSLNSAKARIMDRSIFTQGLDVRGAEEAEEVEQGALEELYWRAYDTIESDEGVEAAIEELQARELLKELEEEIARPIWETGKIRILLRALRLTKESSVAPLLRERFRELMPFVKDVVLLLDEIHKEGDESFEDFGEDVAKMLLEPATQRLVSTRVWLLELFIRGAVKYDQRILNELRSLNGVLDLRQMILLRRRLNDVNYFRRNKGRMDEMGEWLQPAFIFGASCLPQDEFETWLGNVKGRVSFPLSGLYFEWARGLAHEEA